MSDRQRENIHDDLEYWIGRYFLDEGNEKTDRELLDFILEHDEGKLWERIVSAIASSKLGEKIAQREFDNLPEGPDYDCTKDY